MSERKRYAAFKDFVSRASRIHPIVLASTYIVIYAFIEVIVDNPIRLYIYNVFLALSGIYFAWFTGGRLTMFYVAFFNVFIVFIFSKMMWSHNLVVSPQVFLARTFVVIYIVSAFFLALMLRRKSPADRRQAEQQDAIEQEKRQRQNLEFMVASRKLKQDLLAQANLVKDELQLIEGAWRSNIHNIINDLTPVRERELYRQTILPFQNNIIAHLRDLDMRLTFDVRPTPLNDLYVFLSERIAAFKKSGPLRISIEDAGWSVSAAWVRIDKNKVWDMLLNMLRNSQTALDLQRVRRIGRREAAVASPCIRVTFFVEGALARLCVRDNGGGVSPEIERALYREPVPSLKRGGGSSGQGTLFVKFFADRMGIALSAANVLGEDGPGLEACFHFFCDQSAQEDERAYARRT